MCQYKIFYLIMISIPAYTVLDAPIDTPLAKRAKWKTNGFLGQNFPKETDFIKIKKIWTEHSGQENQ